MTPPAKIGPWVFEPENARLIGEGGERRLEDRAARTLALLCAHRGKLVTRDEILTEIWGGRTVSENSVAIVMRDLRRALDDDAKQPRFIETVAKRGYRLTPAVPHRRKLTWLAAALSLLVAATLLFIVLVKPPLTIFVEPVRNETGQASYEPLSQALSELVVDGTAKLSGVTVAAHGRLRLEARLALWNGVPTLFLTARDPAGKILWTGYAEGGEDVIAKLTAAKLAEMGKALRHEAGSEE